MGEFFNFLKICGAGTCYSILILESMTYHEENISFLLLKLSVSGWSKLLSTIIRVYYTWFFGWARGDNCPLSPPPLAPPLRIRDPSLWDYLNTANWKYLLNSALPNSPLISFNLIIPNLTLFQCNRTLDSGVSIFRKNCGDYNIYYSHINEAYESIPSECSIWNLQTRMY